MLANGNLTRSEPAIYGRRSVMPSTWPSTIDEIPPAPFLWGRIADSDGECLASRPPRLVDPARSALRSRHYSRRSEDDRSAGWGRVALHEALARKYPNAPREWRWQWVFPQEGRWTNPRTGEQGRHHHDESILQKSVRRAVIEADISSQYRTWGIRGGAERDRNYRGWRIGNQYAHGSLVASRGSTLTSSDLHRTLRRCGRRRILLVRLEMFAARRLLCRPPECL